jgi:hypothetical protein
MVKGQKKSTKNNLRLTCTRIIAGHNELRLCVLLPNISFYGKIIDVTVIALITQAPRRRQRGKIDVRKSAESENTQSHRNGFGA